MQFHNNYNYISHTKMEITPIIEKVKDIISPDEKAHGELIYYNNDCTILSQSPLSINCVIVCPETDSTIDCNLLIDEEDQAFVPECDGKRTGWNRYSYAALLQYQDELNSLHKKTELHHMKYSREGMIRRVLKERQLKASSAEYKIKWGDNIYGDHILINEAGIQYKIFLRDFENERGYSDSADSQTNKLGTTKHIMYAFRKLKEDPNLYKRLSKEFPFVEIYCDPLNDYKISWYYPQKLALKENLLISRYFKNASFIEDSAIADFLPFIQEAENFKSIVIRPEVKEKIEAYYENCLLKNLKEKETVDYSTLKANLFPYQKEGVEFAVFRKYAIIADEMGLGKTIQAIATAIFKKQIFGFNKILIVCPATLKSQWKNEIEKFSDEKALIIQGSQNERCIQYKDPVYSFFIVNYEMVLRDNQIINEAGFDFLILDEAQKIKNYETKTSSAIRRLKPKHTLIITGTPIENRLIDIYSIMSVLDPAFFGPLWEFSYQHCLFDPEKINKINGYYNLDKLKIKLSEILLRREKYAVLSQLPEVQQHDILVPLSPLQADYHFGFMNGVARIVSKKFLTPYDMQMLNSLLTNARMVCDSTYLIDESTNESPKLAELEDILLEKLDIKRTKRKVIIFSEWVAVHKLIGQLLRKQNIGFVQLSGKIPVKHRGELIRKFEEKEECQVFLSTEAGGAGLNLQMADILINFELPWNPAKKNQRIGRIDRLGQKSNKLTILNLITANSIEQQIAAGLLVKQSLFDGVLSEGQSIDFVDFSTKGRSQFIQQIEMMVAGQREDMQPTDDIQGTVPEKEPIEKEASLEQLELFEEDVRDQSDAKQSSSEKSVSKEDVTQQTKELQSVLDSGLQFLSGIFKMTTGKDLGLQNQKIEIDKETGEVVMRFKIK
ncbi:DEAD/DEAH box helicase [Dysgonomonas sp. 521]|uniref:DEAD/DEAH box helicase n=1 Tax=Dysgonomonas sp. 521 TaxID=2302932 RepID=UPI0013D2FC10|nr:DEAD/DEAH box helicase [Dysgonomonas sp. 521]NDV96100.1 DEAD/DEAH box helicase [Dysgonomonas sp. 521]